MAIVPPGADPRELVSEPTAAPIDVALPAAKPQSLLRRGWNVFAENKLALASVVLLIFILLFCFVGPLIYHTDQVHTNLGLTLCPPGGKHPLGCDTVGYDEVGRLMIGGQTS